MRSQLPLLTMCLLAACAHQPREISGRLVEAEGQTPIAGQELHLDRPPGDYPTLPTAIADAPPPATIATTTTDENGRFHFRTRKDRGRFLTLRLALPSPPDFRAHRGYAVQELRDSLAAASPQVRFDLQVVRAPGDAPRFYHDHAGD